MSTSHPSISSSPICPSSNSHTLADTHLKELGFKSETGDPVAPVADPLSPPNPKTDCSSVRPVTEALGPKSRTRYYVVLTGGGKPLSPESIHVMDVTKVIPKGCMVKARVFCCGVAFNSNFLAGHPQMMKVKLCVVGGSDEELAVIDLDQVRNSQMPEPNIIDGLLTLPAMKEMVSSEKDVNLAEFVGRVGEYVGTNLGEEKKTKYLKMVQDYSSSTSSGLGSFESVEIWHMLTLQDRVMEAVMTRLQLALFVKMPITIEIPSAWTASVTHPTPRVGWKAGCSVAQGLQRRPCIPDLNQVVLDLLEEEEEAESTVGEEGNKGKKRKGEEAGLDVQAQENEVPKITAEF